MALLECKNLCVGYGSNVVQENLNFAIEKGDYFFIIGENGSGKSTLLKTVLGFLKPVSGSIDFSSDWNKKEIGFLPQQTENYHIEVLSEQIFYKIDIVFSPALYYNFFSINNQKGWILSAWKKSDKSYMHRACRRDAYRCIHGRNNGCHG